MPTDRHHRAIFRVLGVTSLSVASLLAVSPVGAEIKTITATGEYRMGDNDTRTDAKRLALLDAKRLALEQAGTYLESVTEVKNLGVARDELNAYTAGIVEVTELSAKDVLEGTTHVVRVEVTAKIDTDVVARQIDALRNNETVKGELMRLRAERDQLKQEVEAKTRQLTVLKSKVEAEAVTKQRQQILTRLEAEDLLSRASVTEERGIKRSLIEQALSLDPFNHEGHFRLGMSLHNEGNHVAAVREYETAIRLAPKIVAYHVTLGLALQANNKVDSAISEFREALRLSTGQGLVQAAASAHSLLGEALLMKLDFDGAVAEYRAAVQLQPENALYHKELGIVLMQFKGDLDGGIEEFRMALHIDPGYAVAYYELGTALLAKRDYSGAIREFRNAVRIQPDYAQAHYGLGGAIWLAGDLDGAIIEFRNALRLQPKYTDARLGLGAALMKKGLNQDAAKEFREFLRLVESHPVNQAIALKEKGLKDEAQQKIRQHMRDSDDLWSPSDKDTIDNVRARLREIENARK
ncbi:MAG: tetratricopeptide repeat protein [Nitrospiraceae bacterium]